MRTEIYSLVELTVSEVLEQNGKIFTGENAKLYCSEGLFDSMDLVNFISILEEKLLFKLDKSLQLSHPSVFSSSNSPFKDIQSATDYILSLL
jgi:acyl carrier protein